MNAIASLAIVGVAVSILVQFLKQHFGGGAKTLAILVVLSVAAGTGYYFIQHNEALISAITTILATANLVYNFVFQWFEKGTN